MHESALHFTQTCVPCNKGNLGSPICAVLSGSTALPLFCSVFLNDQEMANLRDCRGNFFSLFCCSSFWQRHPFPSFKAFYHKRHLHQGQPSRPLPQLFEVRLLGKKDTKKFCATSTRSQSDCLRMVGEFLPHSLASHQQGNCNGTVRNIHGKFHFPLLSDFVEDLVGRVQ